MCAMNVTLSINDDIVERAREVARQQGTSLNAMVRRYLESVAGVRHGEELAAKFDELWRERSGRSGGWRFNREELYDDRAGGQR
jgi:hypothetical protein